MSTTKEIRALTALRMIAAALVVVHHYYQSAPNTHPVVEAIIQEGHIGVTIFFVLSGFLITLRYYAEVKTEVSRQVFFNYFVKRFARIYPLYFTVLLISVLVTTEPYPPAALLFFVTLTHSLFAEISPLFVPPAWTLSVEEGFYLTAFAVYASIGFVLRRVGAHTAESRLGLGIIASWVGLLYLIGLILLGIAALIPALPYGFMDNFHHVAVYTLFGRFFDFAVGMWLAILYQRGQLNWLTEHRLRSLACVAAGMALIVWGQIQMHHAQDSSAYLEALRVFNYPVALGSGVVIVGLLCETNLAARTLRLGIFVYLGRISYALYLIQSTFIAKPALEVARNLRELYGLGEFAHLLLLYLGLNILSALFYEIVEQPARNRILRWGKTLEKRLFLTKMLPP
jgi:peptidoglycan/LPS O-acetylase OafA/YrhL